MLPYTWFVLFKKNMVRKRARKRFRRRRKSRRRSRKKIRYVNSSIPPVRYVKHKYVSLFTLTPLYGTAYQAFSVNGMYDPNYTGGGHQPSGFDRLALMYNQYKVMASSIKFTPGNASAGIGGETIATLLTDTDASISATLRATLENFRTHKVLSNANAGGANKPVYSRWSASSVKEDGVNLTAIASANPSADMFFMCGLSALAFGSVNIPITHCMAEITYYAKWFNPKEQIESN